MAHKPSVIQKLSSWIWSLFFNGLLTILPLTLTVALFNLSFRLVTNWLAPLHDIVEPTILGKIPYSELFLVICTILLIGTIMRILLLRTIVNAFENILFKLPLIRPVYSGIKQLVHAFSIQDKITFKKVVVVEFPRKGIYSLGFLTSELPAEISPEAGTQFYNVFIPTTPNPTSGYFVILSEQNVSIIDLSRQEAMAMIISGGIIQPERFINQPSNHEK